MAFVKGYSCYFGTAMEVNSMQHAGRMQHAQSLVGTDPRGVTLKIWRSEMSICFQVCLQASELLFFWREASSMRFIVKGTLVFLDSH